MVILAFKAQIVTLFVSAAAVSMGGIVRIRRHFDPYQQGVKLVAFVGFKERACATVGLDQTPGSALLVKNLYGPQLETFLQAFAHKGRNFDSSAKIGNLAM